MTQDELDALYTQAIMFSQTGSGAALPVLPLKKGALA